jgi:hypothetical protein
VVHQVRAPGFRLGLRGFALVFRKLPPTLRDRSHVRRVPLSRRALPPPFRRALAPRPALASVLPLAPPRASRDG